MLVIKSKKQDAYYNLSLEEFLLKNEKKEDILLIYINNNFVIFGRNQNIIEEINVDYIDKHSIKLARRISGGGAVYQDTGNINFSFITKNEDASYQIFLEPIINFLKSLGLEAKFEGKNDLTANGFKVSGNAQYRFKDRMVHHGTLLFDSNLTVLSKTLKPNKLKLASKSIKSARQRVSNIVDLLPKKISAEEFVKKLIDYFLIDQNNKCIEVKDEYEANIERLVKEQNSKTWIWGKNPKFNIKNEKRFSGGTIKFEANIENNKIIDLKFSGDFLSSNDFENICKYFLNQDFIKENICKILDEIKDFGYYFGKLTKENLVTLMLG